MTKRRRFLFNGLILTLVGLAMRGSALFLGAYIAGVIGAEGIGLQGLIATVYSLAVTLATSGVSLSVTRLVAASIGEGGGDSRILRGAFLYATFFGLLATALLLLLSERIGVAILLDGRTVGALRILALSLLPMALSGVISGYFVAVRRVTLNAAVNVVGQVMRIGLTVALLVRLSDGTTEGAVRALAIGATVTETVCFLVALIELLVDRRLYGSTENKGYDLPRVAGMALPLAFSAYVRSFLMTVEHSLIPRRLIDRGDTKSEALSAYGYLGGMALPIVLFPMTPLSSFSGLLVPEFAESEGAGDRARMERIASRASSLTLIFATVVAVFIYAFSEELGYVIYGTYEAGRYVAILSPVIPLMYLDHVTDSMLKGIGEHVYSMWVNIADSLLSVALVWALIPLLGILGYAVVIILMELFNFILSFLRLRRRIRFKIDAMRSFIAPLIASLVAVYITSWLFDFGGSGADAVWLVSKMVFALCLLVSFAFAVNMMQKQRNK